AIWSGARAWVYRRARVLLSGWGKRSYRRKSSERRRPAGAGKRPCGTTSCARRTSVAAAIVWVPSARASSARFWWAYSISIVPRCVTHPQSGQRRRRSSNYSLEWDKEPPVGFEPTTARLRIESSTTELRWRGYTATTYRIGRE